MMANALKPTVPCALYPRPSITLTEPSRKVPIRSVWVRLCFSPDDRTVEAVPLHVPSMNARDVIAAFCAEIVAEGSKPGCAKIISGIVAIITMATGTRSPFITRFLLHIGVTVLALRRPWNHRQGKEPHSAIPLET